MADNNRNRSHYASDENWDKNQGRYVDDNNYNDPQSYNPNNLDLDRDGNIGHTGGYFGGTNYMGTSQITGNFLQNPDYLNRSGQNENKDHKSQNYQGYGQQNRQDYNRNSQQGQYGNMSNQYRSGQENYNRNQDYRRNDEHRRNEEFNQQHQYNSQNQWPEDYRYGNTSHYGGGNQGQSSYYGQGMGNMADHGGHGDWGYENRNQGNWNDRRYTNNDYRNTNQRSDYRDRRDDRSWWDKTKDELASWFGGDDDRRNQSDDRRTGEHRGKGPKLYSRSDNRILEDVCDRLSEDGYVDASDIEVKVENGEVTLSGTVDTRTSRRRAEDLVDSISGVKHVQNNLRIGQAMNAGSSTIKSTTMEGDTKRTGNSSDTKL